MELNLDPARLPFNPFNEAQQVQLRAQIIIYGSLVRNRAPEETLMSLCFADISQGRCIEDFQGENLKRSVWHKVWQVAWERDLAAKKASKAPKPAPAAPPKRKTAPVAALESKAELKKVKVEQKKAEVKKKVATKAAAEPPERKVKEKNISELQAEDEFGPSAEDTEQLIEFAATAMKSAAGDRGGGEVYWKSSQDNGPNASRDTGDLTEDKAESVETDEVHKSPQLQAMKGFVKGAHVEVVSDEEGLHGVWFAGKISRVRNSKLLVVYDDLLDEAGKKSLQEWVSVYDPDNEVPKVRLAHPVTSSDLPLKDVCFSVGDHVDVWMNDGWWEGVVEGINSDNHKEVTLFFPGEGDIGVASVSNLRPSLLWKDGKWVAWTQDPEPTVKRVGSFSDPESDSDPEPGPSSEPVSKKEEKVVPASVKKLEPVMLLEGKRKRERPKRLADGLDDDHPPRKPYTRRNPPETTTIVKQPATKKQPPPKVKKFKK